MRFEPADSLTPITFSEVITVPAAGSTQSFISINDIKIDPSTVSPGGNILDAQGVITLKLHFYVNTKFSSENDISEIKFKLYDIDPALRTRDGFNGTSARDLLATTSSAQLSNSIKPIRTVSVQVDNSKKNQVYDVIVSNDEYRKLPEKYQSESKSVADFVTPNTSNSLLDSEAAILRRVLFSSRLDPTDYINWRYFSSSEDIGNIGSGAVILDNSREFTNLNYISLSPKNRQQSLTQKNSDSFTKNSDINLLYQSASESVGVPGPPLRRVLVESNLREYQVLFNIQMRDIDVMSLSTLYLRSEILDIDKNVRNSRSSTLNFSQQIQGHIAPANPASIKVSSQSSSGNTITVKQNDYLASTVVVNRMIINPNYPASRNSTWTQVAQIPLRVSDGSVSYIDTSGSSVIEPSIIIYEAVTSGASGIKCPVSKKVVCRGRRRNPGSISPNRSKTHCSIVAYQDQQNRRIVVKVSDIQVDISRLTLRRQLLSTSLRQNDSRYHDLVRTASGENSYRAGSNQSEYEFIDEDLQDRSIYRYYVEFDSTAGLRTESACDGIIEFRIPPSGKIESSIRSPQIPTPGNPRASFVLSARFGAQGLQDLNNMLTSQGIADLFKTDIKNDRSQISKLLMFEVSRKNTRTGDRIVWPVITPGQFIDDESTRAAFGRSSEGIIPGDTYVYTADLIMLDPESLFTSSTTGRVTADGLRTIQISAKKFAENFSISPGKMQSPTTFSRSLTSGLNPAAYFTGISHRLVVKSPKTLTPLLNVRAVRSSESRPANVIRWNLPDDNIKESIYCFRVDVITNRGTLTPLMTVSPSATADGVSYEVRDEINVNKLVPVQYVVSTIKSDMSRDTGVVTAEIANGSSYPVELLNSILSNA